MTRLLLALAVLALLTCNGCLEPPVVDGDADGITLEEHDDLYTVIMQPTEDHAPE